MKKDALKAITNAHAWVGLIISTILFIVFFAGSLSLFRDNIIAWETNPHFSSDKNIEAFNVDEIITKIAQNYKVYDHGYFVIDFPTKDHPITNTYFEELSVDGEHIDRNLLLSANGDIVGHGDGFNWGNFLYRLHIDLHIPEVGLYFVGIITLFFFVALISGVVIHWRKIFSKFFQYRKEGKKDKWLDAHNIIGVMGLPFHIMYAFTGLVFNLLIIYQISYALLLYGGDQSKLFAAAGVVDVHQDETNVDLPVTGINDLLTTAKKSLGQVNITRLSIDHFGDESASVTFRGHDDSKFSTQKEVTYHIQSGRELYLTKDNYDNNLRGGLSVIASLHFGNFAGYSLRVLFFILGIGTCYIILTGNLMWLDKKAKLRREKQNQLGLQLVKAMTTGGFIGTIFATGVGFICARTLPLDMLSRSDLISQIFFATLFSALIISLFIKNQSKFSALLLKLTALTLAATPILDWLLVSKGIAAMLANQHYDVLIVQACLLCLALCCWLVSAKLFDQQIADENPTDATTSDANKLSYSAQ
ncbi:PepSY-associated TM helix domain-containing protein [Colwelliaceae bacterium MEBiC 14330]